MDTKIIYTINIMKAFRECYGDNFNINCISNDFHFKLTADFCGYALKFESEEAKLIFQMKFLVD